LITRQNITLADVISESVTKSIIDRKDSVLMALSRFRPNPRGIIDPKDELKKSKAKGPVYTMVPFEEVATLSRMAEETLDHQLLEVGR
jgi:hypothetical protein